MKRVLLGSALAFGALASPALAANETIVGNDQLLWDKPNVAIQPGETVTWTFPGTTQAHHVKGDGADVADAAWTTFDSPLGVPGPDASFTFTTAGTYKFVCTVHSTTMFGTVSVGVAAPPPPAPLPLSQQPLANDDTAPVTLEKVTEDKAKPKLSAVRASRSGSRAVRVRFRVNEESTVLVSLKRGGKTIKKGEVTGTGTRSLTLRGAAAGTYRVELRATDVAGNRSSIKRTSITVR